MVRDVEGVLGTGLPVWCDGYAAPPSVAGLTFVGWGEPIGCGGVAVFPNDVVVADQDGAVLIPQGKIAMGKLAQAVMHGAKIIQVEGNFDDCLELARKATAEFTEIELVNSVNPDRKSVV